MKRNIVGYLLLAIFVGALWHLFTNVVVTKPDRIRDLDAEVKFQQEKLISAQILASELNRVSSLIEMNLADDKNDTRTEDASLDFLNGLIVRLDQLGVEITDMKALPRERNIRGYIRTPYFVGFTGSYEQFGRFLNSIEQDSRMIVVEYFKIDNNLTRLNFAKTFDDLKKHEFEIKMSTLTLVKSEAGASRKSGGNS